MRNKVFKLVFCFFTFIIICSYKDVFAAYDSYNIGDYVYFDPVSSKKCSYSNYWTTTNQSGTCYRFLVVKESSSSESTVAVMLDHSVAITTYDNYKAELKNLKKQWTGFSGDIKLIHENTLFNMVKASKKPVIGESVVGEVTSEILKSNSKYTIAGKETDTNGFWTRTAYSADTNYAYAFTTKGSNIVSLKTDKRGIRPLITIDKGLVSNDKAVVNIDNKLSSFKNYSWLGESIEGYTYKQLQGFTLAGDKFFFYSSNNNSEYGLIYGYGGDDFNTKLGKKGYYYGKMGHGNDMTYNSKKNTILVTGPNGYNEIWELPVSDYDNSSKIVKYNTNTLLGRSISALAYNSVDNIYYGKNGTRALSITSDFKTIKDSLIISKNETSQGIEFNDGYLYVTAYEIGSCPNSHQLFCYGKAGSGVIYVYNAKYNGDGTPSPNFGRLVGRFSVSGRGELETVTFSSKNMYLGFAYRKEDAGDKVYRFYRMPLSEIPFGVSASVSYKNGEAIISSVEDLKAVSGWTLSSDKKKLTKKVTSTSETVKVCDRYSNCKTISLKPGDTVKFPDQKTTYTGSAITVSGASCTSKTKITYTYYSDSECTKKIDSIVDAGTYYVKAASAGNDSYVSNYKCSAVVVKKGYPVVSLTEKTSNTYTGKAISANTATAKTPNKLKSVDLGYTYKYYTDSKCSTLAGSGKTPINVGTYYVKAKSVATTNLYSGSSSCVRHVINKAATTVKLSKTKVTIFDGKNTSISYTSNSDGDGNCSSSNTSVVTCSVDGGKIKLTSKGVGTATITFNIKADDNYKASSDSKISVTVSDDNADKTAPEISFSPNGSNQYKKSTSVVVNIEDDSIGLKPAQDVYYAFSESSDDEPTFTSKVTTNNSSGALSTSVTIPSPSDLTGVYYLWIKGGIKDVNDNASDTMVSKQFYFNNTEPDVTASVTMVGSDIKGVVSVESLSDISKYEYSLDGSNYVEFQNGAFVLRNVDDLELDKIYIRVTDSSGNVKVLESDIVDGTAPEINIYVYDAETKSEVSNNVIAYGTKNIEYHVNVFVPDLDSITDKYESFSVTGNIENKMQTFSDKVEVYDKSSSDVTDEFNISITDDSYTIIPKDFTSDSFYDQNYEFILESKISDGFKPTDTLEFKSVSSLNINDNTYSADALTEILYEEYSEIPNTHFNLNILTYVFGLLFLVIGAVVIAKNKRFE